MAKVGKEHKGHEEFKKKAKKRRGFEKGRFGRKGGFSPSGHKHPGKGRVR